MKTKWWQNKLSFRTVSVNYLQKWLYPLSLIENGYFLLKSKKCNILRSNWSWDLLFRTRLKVCKLSLGPFATQEQGQFKTSFLSPIDFVGNSFYLNTWNRNMSLVVERLKLKKLISLKIYMYIFIWIFCIEQRKNWFFWLIWQTETVGTRKCHLLQSDIEVEQLLS